MKTESKTKKRQLRLRMLCVAVFATSVLAQAVCADDPKPGRPLRAFYFGNSLMENAVPWF